MYPENNQLFELHSEFLQTSNPMVTLSCGWFILCHEHSFLGDPHSGPPNQMPAISRRCVDARSVIKAKKSQKAESVHLDVVFSVGKLWSLPGIPVRKSKGVHLDVALDIPTENTSFRWTDSGFWGTSRRVHVDHTSRGWLQLPPTFSFLLPACAHTKVTTRLRVNTSSSNSNPASSDLSAAQPKYIFRHAASLPRRPGSPTDTTGWHANYYFRGRHELLSAHAQCWEKDELSVPDRRRVREGGVWRKKGRRGISLSSIWNWDYPHWIPLPLSLWHSWEASELRRGSSIGVKKEAAA